MGSLYRSEAMSLCQLYIQTETAYNSIAQLGELGIVQFKDMNPTVNVFQRKFVNEVRRCEEIERQLRYFERELRKSDMALIDSDEWVVPEAPPPADLVDLEATFERLESELKEMNNNLEALQGNTNSLTEVGHMLRQAEGFFYESALMPQQVTAEVNEAVEMETHSPSTRLHLGSVPFTKFVSGVIPSDKMESFMRMLWFACRGNVFVRNAEVPELILDAHTGEYTIKNVFMIFFQGAQLEQRVKKICEGFRASLYPCPETAEERNEMAIQVASRLQDLKTVIITSEEQKRRVLDLVNSNIKTWRVKVMKVKAIYHIMNQFHTEGKNYVAECWIPTEEVGTVQTILNSHTIASEVSAPSLVHPVPSDDLPTYFKTNKFTSCFQSIIDAYGVATYKEVNPTPFSIITFPFLFAVMFGDAGHAVILLLFGLWMCLWEKKLVKMAEDSEIFGIIFAGRYLILMMGCFSIYSGLLYNDIYSKSFNIFGTAWTIIYDNKTFQANDDLTLDPGDPNVFSHTPYPFGVDPIWQDSYNKITFTNSFKEKLSVIFALFHMMTGVILSIFNHWYFKSPVDVVCCFLPQVLFMLSLFGYLDALIITKWIIYDASNSNCAPDLLIGFINMFLFNTPEAGDKSQPCHTWAWYPGQIEVQTCLLLLAAFSAIWMLLSKPTYLYLKHKRQMKNWIKTQPLIENNGVTIDTEGALGGETSTDTDLIILGKESDSEVLEDMEAGPSGVQLQEPPYFDTGEEYIHQAIHTIEYCLGCVSHTASYLRLWALSLAHAELSEVLWTMVLRPGLKIDGWWGSFMIYAVFAAFAAFTVAILLLMEGLSAFLHTLRLHWVEFQSKFYRGEGVKFIPFCFKDLLAGGE